MGTVRYTVIDGEVIAEKRNGVRSLYVPDPLGSTVALLDSTQTKTDTFGYWPYGENNGRSGTTPTPLQFVGTAGYYRDSGSRAYVRARTLDTLVGRWLTKDPIGIGVDLNLYQYATASPGTDTDPSGLIVCCKIRCNIEGKNDCRCTGRIFGWGCGNNQTEAVLDAENGKGNGLSANERMKRWNEIHDLHCQKRHCHVDFCQDKKFEKNPLPRVQPVAAPIEAFARCSDLGLAVICIVTATGIVCFCPVAAVIIGGKNREIIRN